VEESLCLAGREGGEIAEDVQGQREDSRYLETIKEKGIGLFRIVAWEEKTAASRRSVAWTGGLTGLGEGGGVWGGGGVQTIGRRKMG